MKLILHIGWNKTGSTAIQSFLHNSHKKLEEQGILITKLGKHLSRHFDFFRLKGEDFTQLVDKLHQEMSEKGCHTAIISDESINKLKSYEKYDYFKNYFDEITVIGFVRRQDLLMESCYNQMLKTPWDKKLATSTLEEGVAYFERQHWFHYDRVFDEFAALFGKENIRVQPFEKGQLKSDLIDLFLDLANLDIDGIEKSSPRSNESVPFSALPFLRYLNSLDMTLCGDKGPVRNKTHQIVRKYFSDESKYVIAHRKRLEILAKYEAGNQKVAQTYLGGNHGKLFHEPPPLADQKIQALTLPDHETMIRDLLVPILSAVKNRTSK